MRHTLVVSLLLSSLVSTAGAAPRVLRAPAKPAPVARTRSLVDQLSGEAKASYQRGKELAQSENWEGAEVQFQAAYDLSHDPRVLMAVATSQKNVGRYADAQTSLEHMVADSSGVVSQGDRTEALAFLAVLKPFVGKLRLEVVSVDDEKVESLVEGASVTVDGKPLGRTPIFGSTLVAVGRKTKIHVEKVGFTPLDAEFTAVSNNEVVQRLVLQAAVARIDVRCPSGATVWVDDAIVGVGNWAGRLSVGSHRVRCVQDGSKPYEALVDMKDGSTRTVEVAKLEGTGLPWWVWVGGGVVVAGGAAVGGYCLLQGCVTAQPEPVGPSQSWLGVAQPGGR